MNYKEKFLQLLKISDNLKTGAFGADTTEYSERGFHLFSQTSDLDVVFDPATQDWSVRCEYEDEFNIEGHREVVSEHGNGWNELVSYLFYDSDLTWFLNAKAIDINSLKECVVVESADNQEEFFSNMFKPGNKLIAAHDIYYSDLDNLFWDESFIDNYKKLGFIKDNKFIIPRGTKLTAVTDKGPSGWPAAIIDKTGDDFDFAFSGTEDYDEHFIVLSEHVITEDTEDFNDANLEGNPNVINDEHDAVAFIECIDWEPLNKFVSGIIGTDVKFAASNVRAARGYSGSAQYYVDVADPRNFANECGIMSPVYSEVLVDCFNSAICKNKETGESYFWCTPAFRYHYKSGGSNGTNIATAIYKNGEWVEMRKDWSDID